MQAGIMELDVHGMTKMQAQTYLDHQLKGLKSSVYRVRIIHGFHGGTQLREMIRQEYLYHSKVIRIEQGTNPGETIFILREL
ncbi:MAG TPA: Smr/MutS family protein [Lachnospiraceae bacterium]|nr:Smr/MutS family protein [Lachnospiraceae bacterium]